MATNGIWIEQEAASVQKDNGLTSPDLVLAPLVDKIAYGLARGLVIAFKELENHIASETRNVGEAVGRRLDTLQACFQDLADSASQQRAMNLTVQEQCQRLAAATASLQESDARQAAEFTALRSETGQRLDTLHSTLSAATVSLQESDSRHEAELAALRNETRELSTALSERIDVLCKDLGVQQEDISAVKSTLSGFSSRVDTVMERLDRQADALRSIYATYARRETELEQLVDGLARLRAYPAPAPTNGL